MKRFKIITSMLIVLSMSAFGQTELSINILSLEECMTLAVENAPELKSSNAIVEQAKIAEERTNTSWVLENMSIIGNSSYVYRKKLGENDVFNDDLEENVDGQVNNTTSFYGPQFDARVGVSLNLPLSTWKYKKHNKAIASAFTNEKEGIHEAQILQIKNQVVVLYKRFEQASQKMNTASDNIETQKSALNIAEQHFTDGIIDVEKYSNVKASAIAAEDAFNDAKTVLEIAYNALKLRIGKEIIVE